MADWQQSVDLISVGSGGGGLMAAIAAKDAGLAPLVLEKQREIGGSTAMSGGMIWVPNNPLMQAEGIPDSHEEGMAYFDALVGDVGPASSTERRDAYLTAGSAMIAYLVRKGAQFTRCPGYSDYYPLLKGANIAGRAIESVPWDAHRLGEWQDKIKPGIPRGLGLVGGTNELRSLKVFNRGVRPFAIASRVFLRTKIGKLRNQDLLTNGMGLVAQMTKIAIDSGVPIWLKSPVEELIVEEGRVVGVRTLKDGESMLIEARRGVLLDAGGYERNPEMRRKYGRQPNESQWTFANHGNTGEMLEAAMGLGAQTEFLDEAWWNPMPRPELAASSTFSGARQLPRTIMVNSAGRRFCNESNSYVEVGIAMYENDAVPAWLIFDDEYRRRYIQLSPGGMVADDSRKRKSILKSMRPGRMSQEWFDRGWVKKADSIDALAKQIGLDPDALSDTVRNFNRYAVQGEDPEFGRGRGAYNACLGDPGDKVNPAVGPLDKAPFCAIQIFPADVGTSGGVICDEHGRVLDQEDRPIPGLYATGNMTAPVMGRTYPGAGSSIGATMAFGWVAARHVAGLPLE